MLCLSRRPGEIIHIGEDITITVVDIDRNKVKLGIVAPREIPVNRHEIWLEIKKSEREKKDSPTGVN